MDSRNKGTVYNNAIPALEPADINAIIAQRDQLQAILIQRDALIELLLSQQKHLDARSLETVFKKQLDEQSNRDKSVTSVSDLMGNSNPKSQTNLVDRPAPVHCDHLSPKCCILKDLNKSLDKENENLKALNESLHNNYSILIERLERVQSEHEFRIKQLRTANELLTSAFEGQSTKKRFRSPQYDDSSSPPESQNKRRRLTDIEGGHYSIDDVTNRNGVVGDCSENDESSDIEENGVVGDCSGNDESSDIEDDKNIEDNSDSGSDLSIIEIDSESETDNESESNKDSEVEDNFIKPLSQYTVVTKGAITTGKQSLKNYKKILTETRRSQD